MAQPTRDSAQTRSKILAAARREFSTSGFAGARVDEIAKAAGCDKRLIYRYFSDKAGLFTAVMHAALSCKREVLGPLREDLGESFARAYPTVGADPEWLRIVLWEALEDGDSVVAKSERKAEFRTSVAAFESLQEAGAVGADIEPAYGAMVMASLLMFPWVMPQFVRIACGKSPKDPQFRDRYVATVRRIFAFGVGALDPSVMAGEGAFTGGPCPGVGADGEASREAKPSEPAVGSPPASPPPPRRAPRARVSKVPKEPAR